MSTASRLNEDKFYYFAHKTHSTLSNFYPCHFKIDDQEFNSSEQAYQHSKATFHKNLNLANRILTASNPLAIYRLGKQVPSLRNWQQEKVGVMQQILEGKLVQCCEFQDELHSTDRMVLVEDTFIEFLGKGRCGAGRNVLGLLLMELRHRQFHI